MTESNGCEKINSELQLKMKARSHLLQISSSGSIAPKYPTVATPEGCISSSNDSTFPVFSPPSSSSTSSSSNSMPSPFLGSKNTTETETETETEIETETATVMEKTTTTTATTTTTTIADTANSLFRITNIVGSGVSGQVYRVINTQDGCVYALKIVQFHNSRLIATFQNECQMLAALRKQNGVIKMIDCYTTPSCGYLVTQCEQFDLFNYAAQTGGLGEAVARQYVRRLVEIVQQLHDVYGIAHRDIKPENVVLTPSATHKTRSMSSVAMIDFGDALIIKDDWKVSDVFVGTTCYLAPERWRKHYHWECKASDMWSIGVLTYEILTNKRCFYDDVKNSMIDKIQNGIWAFPEGVKVSYLCQHFIQTLLCIDTNKRPSARMILQHPWLNMYENEKQMQLAVMQWNQKSLINPFWMSYYPGPKKTQSDYRNPN